MATTRGSSASRWGELVSLCASLPDVADLDQLMEEVVGKIAVFFHGAPCAAFLKRGGRLAPVASVGFPNQPPAGLPAGSGRGLHDYLNRFMAPGRCLHSMNGPMSVDGKTAGYLVVCSGDEAPPGFSGEDRQMLKLLAHRVALSMVVIETGERARGRQEALARIAAALAGEIEVRRIAETAATLAIREMGADSVVVWIAREEERLLELLVCKGFSKEVADQVRRLAYDAPALAAWTAITRQVQTVEDAATIPEQMSITRRLLTTARMKSTFIMPLVARERLMGVLSYARKSPHRWTDEERQLASTLADLLAAAIFNGQMYEELAETGARANQLATLAAQRAAELEAIISNIADAVFVCDPQGRITFVNSAALEMIGEGAAGELRNLPDYLATLKPHHPDGQPVGRQELAISRALRGQVVRGEEQMIHIHRSGHDRHILVSAAPVRDSSGRFLGAVEVFSDITRLKELDLLKDQFITVAAHEIKTPVTAIKGFAQTLARAPDACSPRYHRALETIVQQSDRIDALVKDFLDISRMRWGRVKLTLERIDLTTLVTEAVARKASAAPRHHLVMARSDRLFTLGDRERLNQVMENLLDNAVKFSPGGGEVEAQCRRQERRAVVSLRDQGVGIPPERQEHLFERFYRAHIGTPYDYGGLGVGLYISREIVRQHGGELWFESEEGKGSTFYFSLPLADGGEG